MVDESKFDVWAVVELFGHQRIAGRVTEQVIAGQGFIRVDVPAIGNQSGFTRLFGSGAIYSIILHHPRSGGELREGKYQ